MSEEVNIVITATDKASSVFMGIQKILGGVTSSISKLTGEYIKYGDEVSNLSRFIGINNEESSRLIQVADDAFVSYDTLRLAAKNLSEKGFQPNIQSIAKLSDEYLRLNPGLERSQFLIDKFGRSGMEMSKLMELGSTKINQMNDSIEKGLIIDDQKAASILRVKQAQDRFNDSLQAVKYEFADKLLTTFEALPKPIQDTVLALGVVGQSGLLQSMSQMAIIISNITKGGGAATAIKGIGEASAAAAPGIWASVGPLALLAGAIAFLAKVIIDNWGTLMRLQALIAYGVFGKLPEWAWNLPSQSNDSLLNVMPKRARGGPVAPGQTVLVGENGPEPFTAGPTGGYVAPHGAAPTFVVNINGPFFGDRLKVKTELQPVFDEWMRGYRG